MGPIRGKWKKWVDAVLSPKKSPQKSAASAGEDVAPTNEGPTLGEEEEVQMRGADKLAADLRVGQIRDELVQHLEKQKQKWMQEKEMSLQPAEKHLLLKVKTSVDVLVKTDRREAKALKEKKKKSPHLVSGFSSTSLTPNRAALNEAEQVRRRRSMDPSSILGAVMDKLSPRKKPEMMRMTDVLSPDS